MVPIHNAKVSAIVSKLLCKPSLLPLSNRRCRYGSRHGLVTHFRTIQTNFSIPSITFNHNNSSITLKGDPKTHITHTTFHKLNYLIHINSIASLHLMSFNTLDYPTYTTDSPITFPGNQNPEIAFLILQFPTVFQQKCKLPPSRSHDHHIPLFSNTTPISVKLYHYPHVQKEPMTLII